MAWRVDGKRTFKHDLNYDGGKSVRENNISRTFADQPTAMRWAQDLVEKRDGWAFASVTEVPDPR